MNIFQRMRGFRPVDINDARALATSTQNPALQASRIASQSSTVAGGGRSLAGKIMIDRRLPTKREIGGATKRFMGDLIRKPKRTIQEGIVRHKSAMAIYNRQTGLNKMQAARKVATNIGTGAYKGGGKDILVNTGGFLGSKAGAMVGGKPIELAGDWAGAAAARKGLDMGEAHIAANKIKNNPAFQRQSPQIQKQIIAKRSKGFSSKIAKNYPKEVRGDTYGWGIGNAAAEGLTGAGVRFPFKGAAVASATAVPVRKGVHVARRVARSQSASMGKIQAAGTGVRMGIQSTVRNTGKRLKAASPYRLATQGFARERKMTNSINSQLDARLPRLTPGTNFKKYSRIISFSRKPLLLCNL